MRAVRSNWQGAILVCGKCSKKVKGGFGPKGRERLAKILRRHIGAGGDRGDSIGVVETKCLDVCPKRAVVVVDSRRPDHWHVVEPGTDPATIARHLDLPPAKMVLPHST